MSWAKVYQILCGRSIPNGCFRGMRYITACIGSALWPKVIGTYEVEMAGAVEALIALEPDLIVNAGAAEGYYAVGLALRCPRARVVAYELEAEGRKLIRLLAGANNVADRIYIRGECEAAGLERDLAPATSPAIVMDVEAAECWLLDLEKCPSLKRTAVLVELHDYEGECTGSILRARFRASHAVVQFESAVRTFQQLPFPLRLLGSIGWRAEVMSTMEEGRGVSMRWLWMTPLKAGIGDHQIRDDDSVHPTPAPGR